MHPAISTAKYRAVRPTALDSEDFRWGISVGHSKNRRIEEIDHRWIDRQVLFKIGWHLGVHEATATKPQVSLCLTRGYRPHSHRVNPYVLFSESSQPFAGGSLNGFAG